MYIYAKESGIAITDVRISNFRAIANIEVELGDLTVLIGANNAGKTTFLDALLVAVGVGRRSLGQDDIHIGLGEESFAPKDRKVIIDVRIRPIGNDGLVADKYPEGSFWTSLWGAQGIVLDDIDFLEFTPIRTTLSWNIARAEYVVERRFLKEWRPLTGWLEAQVHDRQISAAQLESVALHYIDAKRDLDDDIRRQGSFWGRMTGDLGLSAEYIVELEEALSGINQQVVEKSEILKHLRINLGDLQSVTWGESAGIDISPVARKLRDLSKGIDVSFSTAGGQPFPLSRHGMGTRSLASLLVFRAFAAWRNTCAAKEGNNVHSMLALEEPESHLHPQAQRSLFSHIKAITGQRVVSTHSPYFAGQAQLEDLRLFIKRGGDTSVAKLDISQLTRPDDKRKLQETVIASRGDLLFARAIVIFEGHTEEQALPIWAQKYWGASIHELGFSFVRANGTDYFPFIWLAKSLNISWYVIADGEPSPVKTLNKALMEAGESDIEKCANVVVIASGNNFEALLLTEGYLAEIESALDEVGGTANCLDTFIHKNHDKPYPKGKGNRDYKSENGRLRAAADAMKEAKTKLAKPLARIISELPAPERRFPSSIRRLFEIIGADHDLKKVEGENV